MKNYPQVYVKNSIKAANHYCQAFGATITTQFFNEDKTAYVHCVLNVKGDDILALAEAKNNYDIKYLQVNEIQTMTFNAFELKSQEAVINAFKVLSKGGKVIEDIHQLPWSECCATIIDKYGVCWWISK